jgi:ABC-type uncharacterized transport system involved in gliding motility auxiliary subunit
MSDLKMKNRSLAFGANSAFITILVIAIVVVLNFLAARYPKKLDLTRNQVHTLSDQTKKTIQGLSKELTLTLYSDFGGKERYKPILENYKDLNPKVKLEWVDPNKEPARVRAAGIRKANTLQLNYDGKLATIEDVTEEKLTNQVIKLTKNGKTLVCTLQGHGERSLSDTAADGMSAFKMGLDAQSYDWKDINLTQSPSVPADCTVVLSVSPLKAFFKEELKTLDSYLTQGGRFVIGIESSIAENDPMVALHDFLKSWGISIGKGIVIDPLSQIASLAIVPIFSKDVAITRDFAQEPAYLPVVRPIDAITPPAEGMRNGWLLKSHSDSWAETDLQGVAKGTVRYDRGADTKGPISVGAYAAGKRTGSTADKETRIVAIGSGQFANNQFSRYGVNLDLLLNSVSWAAEDESAISIRAKDDEDSKFDVNANQEAIIRWATIIIIPFFVAIAGVVIWIRRKKL